MKLKKNQMKTKDKKTNISKLKDVVLGNKKMEEVIIENHLNKLLYADDEVREDRVGMHGSGVIASDEDFCYRQQVLSFHFKGKEAKVPEGLKRIFLNGWYVHEKWQKLFIKSGVAVSVEQRGESQDWNLLFTPDAVVKLGNKLYVVEIKSVNTYTFNNMNSHPSGAKQLQLYMHMLGIPQGFVLCEDKNNQNIKIFYYEYDPMQAKPYVERMLKVKNMNNRFKKDGTLPSKMCDSSTCKKALGCPYMEACFNINRIPIVEGAKTGSRGTKAEVNQ